MYQIEEIPNDAASSIYSAPFDSLIEYSPQEEDVQVMYVQRRPKRVRTQFTTEQLNKLEASFDKQTYLAVPARNELAKKLKLSERNVQVWFQNRRKKFKSSNNNVLHTKKAMSPSHSLSSHSSSPSSYRSEPVNTDQAIVQQIRFELMEYIQFPSISNVQIQQQSPNVYENYAVPVDSMNPLPVIPISPENHQFVNVESNSNHDLVINENHPYEHLQCLENPQNFENIQYENVQHEIQSLGNVYSNGNDEENKSSFKQSVSNMISSVPDDFNVNSNDASSNQFCQLGFEALLDDFSNFTNLPIDVSSDWSLFPQFDVRPNDFLSL